MYEDFSHTSGFNAEFNEHISTAAILMEGGATSTQNKTRHVIYQNVRIGPRNMEWADFWRIFWDKNRYGQKFKMAAAIYREF